MRRRLALLTALVLAAAAGCSLPGGAPSGPSYQVTAEFGDVLDLVPQAAVKVNDVTVGSVQGISLAGWTARVRLSIGRDVKLPANATAAIRQTSLLGEKFVELSAPAGEPAQGTLTGGSVIPLSRTSRAAEVEEVLAALGMLLGDGGLAQIKTINEELTQALAGRETVARDTLSQLDTFIAGLDAQKADIVHAIDALDRLSGHLAQQRDTLATAIDSLDPGLTVLAQEREQLTGALTALSDLSVVGTRVVDASTRSTAQSLASLRPILDDLAHAGDNLPRALQFMLTYPFPPNVVGAVTGDSVRLHVTLDLNGADILANLLTSTAGKPANSSAPGTVPVPAVPGVPLPHPTPSTSGPGGSAGSPGGTPGNSGSCGLLAILTGCG